MEDILKKYVKLLKPKMGTENVGPLLYSLIQKVRPEKVLEVGLGYSTAFISEGLSKVKSNFDKESKILSKIHNKMENIKENELSIARTLNPEYYVKPYNPVHICIDDFSLKDTNAQLVLEELKKNNLLKQTFIIKSDFRGKSKEILNKFGKINFVWFDCGGPKEYRDFINEYWELIENDSYLLFHFTFSYLFKISDFEENVNEKVGKMMENKNHAAIYAKVKDEILLTLNNKKKKYEIISLVEPHKYRQSSVTIVKKL